MLVIVEWAEARVVAPRLAEFHPRLRDEVYDVDAGFYFVDGGHGQQRKQMCK
jgi:hypothetical protein